MRKSLAVAIVVAIFALINLARLPDKPTATADQPTPPLARGIDTDPPTPESIQAAAKYGVDSNLYWKILTEDQEREYRELSAEWKPSRRWGEEGGRQEEETRISPDHSRSGQLIDQLQQIENMLKSGTVSVEQALNLSERREAIRGELAGKPHIPWTLEYRNQMRKDFEEAVLDGRIQVRPSEKDRILQCTIRTSTR